MILNHGVMPEACSFKLGISNKLTPTYPVEFSLVNNQQCMFRQKNHKSDANIKFNMTNEIPCKSSSFLRLIREHHRVLQTGQKPGRAG